jgi:dihydropteroate synthase
VTKLRRTKTGPASAQGFSSSARLYLRPVAVTPGASAGLENLQLAGGPLKFAALEIALREGEHIHRDVIEISAVFDWAETIGRRAEIEALLARISAPRGEIAGLKFDRPRLMGILNVTPDSFFDGGRDADAAGAVERGLEMIEAGADIIDVGGESTRPGATPVGEDEEAGRVLPVIAGLAEAGAPLSIDSRRAGVMRQALAAGAVVINDVHALTGDGCLSVAADARAPVILMHGPADPQVMAQRTDYADVLLDVYDWLSDRIEACEAAGLARRRIMVDPGIGFAKTAAQSAAVIGGVALFHGLGCPIVLGASRKSFIAGVSGGEPGERRLAGSISAALYALSQGVQVFRVHDVADTRQAFAVWRSTTGV